MQEIVQSDLQKIADDLLLSRYTPAAVVVNEALQIIQQRGNAAIYLEKDPGIQNPAVFTEIPTLIKASAKEKKAVKKENIPLQLQQQHHLLTLEVIPLEDTATPHWLIIFHKQECDNATQPANEGIDNLTEKTNKTSQQQTDKDNKRDHDTQQLTAAPGAENVYAGAIPAVKKAPGETDYRYANLVHSSPSLIAILQGENMLIQTANDAILSSWGKGRNIIGKSLFEVMPEIVEQGFKERLQEVYQTGMPYKALQHPVYVVRNGKNELTYYSFIYQAQKDAEGNIEGVAIIATDVTAEAALHEQLKRSEEKFQAAVAAVEGIVWTNNAKGEMEGEQPAWAGLTGQTLEEYKGYGWAKVIHPEDAQATIHAWQEAIRSRSTFIFEHRVKVKDGSWRHFSIRAVPLKDAAGDITEWVGVHTDITEKILAQKALKENEEKFRAMAESSDILIGVNDETINAVYFNQAWEKLTGRPVNQLLDLGWLDLLHPEDKEPFLNKFLTAFNNKESYDGEFRILNKEGTYSWLYAKVQVRLHPDGSYAGHISSCIDITERKNNESALKESETLLKKQQWLYEAVTQSTPDLVYVIDLNYRFTYANKALLQMWGRTLEDSVGRGLLELGYEPWHAEMHEREIDEIVATKKSIRGEVSFPHAVLGRRIYDYIFAPVINEKGEVIAVSGTTRDISDIKNAESELEQSREQFSTLADNMENLAWLADSEGSIYWYNKRWLEYTGLTLEEMQAGGWEKIHHPDHVERIVEMFKKTWQVNETFELTFPLRRQDGEYRWFLTRGYPVTNEDGKIIRWIGTNTDITEHKKAEDQFRVLADQAPMWVWLTDKEINVLYANPELLNFIGIDHYSEFTGHLWEAKVHPEDIQLIYKTFGEAASSQQSFAIEYRVQNYKTGKYEWFYIKGVPRHEGGEFTGFIGTGININEQKIIVEQLEYRKALLEAHNESSIDGILLVDTKGSILSYNHRFLDIWDMPQQIADSKDDEAALLFAVKQLTKPQQFIERVKWLYEHPDEISIDELEFLDGKIIERHGYPVKASDGSYYAWSWIFRDITQQKKSDRAIKESEATLRRLAEEMPQKIVNTDRSGKVFYYNKNWLDYTGLSLDELYGDGWAKVIHPDELEQLSKRWMESVTTGKVFEMEHRIRNKDGEFNWHINRAVPVRNERDEITNWIGAATEIQKIKEEVKRREDFLKMVSHELKTPVTSIKGYVQLLLSILPEDSATPVTQIPLQSSLERIDKQIVRLTRLIDEMLDLGRLEESKLVIDTQTFSIKTLVEETIQDILHTSSSHSLQLDAKTDGEIEGDRDRIQQVLINLINNAIKYSPLNRKIDIAIHAHGDKHIAVSVKDLGIGINQQDLQKIFERFYRVSGKNEETYSGFGIGLFIANQIIEKHHGSITVESEAGRGSVFTFILPLVNK